MIITYTSSKAISTIPKSSYGCTTAKRFSSSFRGNSINVTPKRKTYKKLPKVPSTEFMSPGSMYLLLSASVKKHTNTHTFRVI